MDLVCQAEQYCILLATSVQLGRHSRALSVVCTSFDLFCRVGLGNWCLEGCGVLAPISPCAQALLSPMQALWREGFGGCRSQGCHGIWLDLIRGITLLSRHHSPSLSFYSFYCK